VITQLRTGRSASDRPPRRPLIRTDSTGILDRDTRKGCSGRNPAWTVSGLCSSRLAILSAPWTGVAGTPPLGRRPAPGPRRSSWRISAGGGNLWPCCKLARVTARLYVAAHSYLNMPKPTVTSGYKGQPRSLEGRPWAGRSAPEQGSIRAPIVPSKLVILVHAGSARHRKAPVLGGHERSRSASQNHRS
jgi:hypothetical protein